jgi:hypothetical protein
VDGIKTPTHVRCGAMRERAGDHGERRRRQARRDCAIKPPVLPVNPTTTLLLNRPCHNNHPSPCCFSAFLGGRGRAFADRTTDAFHLAGAAAILANAGRAAGPDAVGVFAVSGGAEWTVTPVHSAWHIPPPYSFPGGHQLAISTPSVERSITLSAAPAGSAKAPGRGFRPAIKRVRSFMPKAFILPSRGFSATAVAGPPRSARRGSGPNPVPPTIGVGCNDIVAGW